MSSALKNLNIGSTIALNNGIAMPRLGLGVFESHGSAARDACIWAFKAGYRHVDSAQYYKNEAHVVEAVKSAGVPRDQLYITTKVFDVTSDVSAKIATSLKIFEPIGYIDLFLIHSPIGGAAARKNAWAALEKAVEEGRVKSIGVSNYGPKHIEELMKYARIKPVVNQVELHPWCQQRDIVAACKKYDIVVQAYTPLTRARKFDDPTLVEIASKFGKDPAQILVRWGLQKDLVTLPKSEKEARIISNADVYNFEIDDVSMTKLDALDQGSSGAITWNPVTAE